VAGAGAHENYLIAVKPTEPPAISEHHTAGEGCVKRIEEIGEIEDGGAELGLGVPGGGGLDT
jgi:hypothetical protein